MSTVINQNGTVTLFENAWFTPEKWMKTYNKKQADYDKIKLENKIEIYTNEKMGIELVSNRQLFMYDKAETSPEITIPIKSDNIVYFFAEYQNFVNNNLLELERLKNLEADFDELYTQRDECIQTISELNDQIKTLLATIENLEDNQERSLSDIAEPESMNRIVKAENESFKNITTAKNSEMLIAMLYLYI